MDELGRILWPDMAVILNAATGHSEGLGDMGVAYYKAQLLNFLPQNGSAYVSGDYPDLFVHACYNKTDTKFFSTSSKKFLIKANTWESRNRAWANIRSQHQRIVLKRKAFTSGNTARKTA